MLAKNDSAVVAALVGLSLIAGASCTFLGASLDPLAASSEGPTDAARCFDGQCTGCPAGQLDCGGACVAPLNDPVHCGSCTTACNPGEACGDGHCAATCPDGQTSCDGACVDLQLDSSHCGACGRACGAEEECVDANCVIACKTQLNQPLKDAWGWSWDGLERAASTVSNAQAVCGQFRGRLPTVSELYRVSATQSATVGQTVHTNPLWSIVPASPGVHVTVRLSDAAVSSAADTTAANYRCVCPPRLTKVYAGNNCFGDRSGDPCVRLDSEGGLHNLDTKDRPAVPRGAAVWECAFSGGHLTTALQLAEAIQQNIGPGTGIYLHSADEVRSDFGAYINWTDPKTFAFNFTGGANNSNGVSWNVPMDPHPFRCVGENTAPPALPAVAGQWGPGRRKIDAEDRAPDTLIQAVDQCFTSGGHLPMTAELNELVAQGAPNGSGTFLWTADHTGSNGTNHTVSMAKWTGVQTDHLYGGADMSWSYKTGENRPYRCIYDPVDPAYQGPHADACQGGCTTIASPGSAGGKSWFDSNDRAGATVSAAIDSCRKLGGHLASARDLTEAIRAGLPNGSDVYLNTSDAEIGSCGAVWGVCDVAAVYVATVKWKGTMPTFDDLWENSAASRASWAHSYDVNPYRCMWTNELR